MTMGTDAYNKRRLAPYEKHPVDMNKMLKMSVINDRAHMYFIRSSFEGLRSWTVYNYTEKPAHCSTGRETPC